MIVSIQMTQLTSTTMMLVQAWAEKTQQQSICPNDHGCTTIMLLYAVSWKDVYNSLQKVRHFFRQLIISVFPETSGTFLECPDYDLWFSVCLFLKNEHNGARETCQGSTWLSSFCFLHQNAAFVVGLTWESAPAGSRGTWWVSDGLQFLHGSRWGPSLGRSCIHH